MDYTNFEPRRTISLKLTPAAHRWFTSFSKAYGKSKQAVLEDLVIELKFQTVNERLDIPIRLRIRYAVLAILQRRSFREIQAEYVRPTHYRAKTPVWLVKESEN